MLEYTLDWLQKNDLPLLNSIKPENWGSITEIHEHYLKTGNCHCIKAVHNNRIIGIGTGICFENTGWLAHIIVSSEYQKKGIGSSIVRNRIENLIEGNGCKVITLTATDQGYPVYKKIGFIDESMYIIMERNEIQTSSEDTIEKIIKAEPRHYSGIFELDKEVSGENRKELLSSVIDTCYVFEDNKKVAGYYLPEFGDSGVIAETEEAGIALLKMRIKEQKKLFIPEENAAAYRFLISQGYKEVKRIYRMIYGEGFSRKPGCCYARIGGFAG